MEAILATGLLIFTIALWLLAIIDVVRSRFITRSMNTFWLLIVLFFPVLGSIFYFLLKKKFTTKESRKFQPDFN